MTDKHERLIGVIMLLIFFFAAQCSLIVDIQAGEASYEAGTVAYASTRYEVGY